MAYGIYYTITDLIRDGFRIYTHRQSHYMVYDEDDRQYRIYENTKGQGRKPIIFKSASEIDAATKLMELNYQNNKDE